MSIRHLVIASVLLNIAMAANAMTAQQERMKGCSTQAHDQNLHGAPYKGFMKTCLSNASAAAPAAAAPTKKMTAQQEKMKTCNADAKTKALKGADRRAFMKSCLSGG